VGWCWFLVVLGPVLGIIQIGDQAMADRYSYVAFIGLFIGVVWQLAEWMQALGAATRPRLSWALSLGTVAVLSVMCFFQVQTWRSNEALFSHAIAVTSGNYVAEYNLGVALWEKKDREGAKQHFQEAVRIRKPVLEAQIAAADAAAARNAYGEAIPRLTRVLLLMPWNSELHQRLGSWLALDRQSGKALMQFDAALKYEPDWIQPRISIAVVLLGEGQTQKAEGVLRDVLAREPGNADAKELLERLKHLKNRE
jgi:tetratricopeptide (TPR) repeat protein